MKGSHPEDLATIRDLEGRNAVLGQQYANALLRGDKWKLRAQRRWLAIAVPWCTVGILLGALSVLWAFRGVVTVVAP